jgi:CPA1 family monovalent cation:H+ antiporter
MLSLLDLGAILLTLTAAFGWINHKFIRLPHTIGLVVVGLAASLVLVAVEALFPRSQVYETLSAGLAQIDFRAVVMDAFLAFLLFAGALHVDLGELRERAWPIAILATVGVAVSTALVGLGVWLASGAIGLDLPLLWALVFGALISPTDPVAVLSTLKRVRIAGQLAIKIEGEALFNDGIGVVAFTVLLLFATGAGEHGGGIDAFGVAELLAVEFLGGALLGLAAGWLAYRAMGMIDDYAIEVLITLALVTATYAAAQRLHLSGPIAVVVAGLFIGNRGTRYAMSERTKGYVLALWTLMDEVLNSVLFLLIGLEVLLLHLEPATAALGLVAIPLVLAARLASVSLPVVLLHGRGLVSARNLPFVTWAGVRGGISVALALSLPAGDFQAAILVATYAVVLFSIIVQGLTLPAVARWTAARGAADDR